MSQEEKTIVEEYCRKMDARHKRLIGVLYALVTGIVLGSVLIFVSFGEVKAQGRATADTVDFINKNYIPTIYVDGMQQNMYYYVQEIVATVSGSDEQKLSEIGQKYFDFQQTMTKQMISWRGGISNTTRSITQPITK